MEVVNKLNSMKNELMARGWSKSKLERDNGNICLLGARNIVIYGSSLVEESENSSADGYSSDEITEALAAVILEDPEMKEYIQEYNCSSSTLVYTYNDRANVGFNDIVDLIDMAIIKHKDQE